jgi:hypothetical protein
MVTCKKCKSPYYCVCEWLIEYGNCPTCMKYSNYCRCKTGTAHKKKRKRGCRGGKHGKREREKRLKLKII